MKCCNTSVLHVYCTSNITPNLSGAQPSNDWNLPVAMSQNVQGEETGVVVASMCFQHKKPPAYQSLSQEQYRRQTLFLPFVGEVVVAQMHDKKAQVLVAKLLTLVLSSRLLSAIC